MTPFANGGLKVIDIITGSEKIDTWFDSNPDGFWDSRTHDVGIINDDKTTIGDYFVSRDDNVDTFDRTNEQIHLSNGANIFLNGEVDTHTEKFMSSDAFGDWTKINDFRVDQFNNETVVENGVQFWKGSHAGFDIMKIDDHNVWGGDTHEILVNAQIDQNSGYIDNDGSVHTLSHTELHFQKLIESTGGLGLPFVDSQKG